MKVLIVIPAYNRLPFLARSIRSVLGQSFTDYRLVVVDDASTEDLSSCRKVVEESGHTWLALSENQGPAKARNEGASQMPFDWVMFLDSDDVWMPDKVEKQMAWHLANPEVRISQVKERWIRNGSPFKKPAHLKQPEGEIFADCVERCSIGPSCVAIRHDLWAESGGFDEWFRVCEDYELWLRIASREMIGLIPGPELMDKHGGHSDQLSTAVPALDRFRFVALAQFLNSRKTLPAPQREIVMKALNEKKTILGKGAAKRGRDEWATFFEEAQVPLSPEEVAQAKAYCEL